MNKKIFSLFTILLFLFPIHSYNFKINEKKNTNNYGYIIDQENGNNYSGSIIDSDFDGYGDTLYMWGNNQYGQIGNGTKNDVNNGPIKILPKEESWEGNLINLELGDSHSGLTVDTDYNGYGDTLYMWGNNNLGQLGNNSELNNFTYPQKILPEGKINWGGNIIDLSLGEDFTGLTIDSNLDGYGDILYMWGDNSFNQLGVEGNSNYSYPITVIPENESWNGNLMDLELGKDSSGLTVDTNYDGYADTVYMWGDNQYDQLGQGQISPEKQTFPKITEPDRGWNGNITDISVGYYTSGVIVDNNDDNYADTLYMWGSNINGVMGNNISLNPSPITIYSFPGNLIDFETNNQNSGILVDVDLDGYADTLYMWGSNQNGQDGIGSYTEEIIYTPIEIFPYYGSWNGNILDFSIGSTHISTLIDINNDGYEDTLYMWGSNEYGEAGIPASNDILLPNDIFEFKSFSIENITIINDYDHGLKLEIKLDDFWDLFNENNIPIIYLIDLNNNFYNTLYDQDNSNINDDLYYYQIDQINPGTKYIFDKIEINNNLFNLESIIAISDYTVSDLNLESIGTNQATLKLDLILGDNVNISYFDNEQKQVKVNFADGSYQEVIIDQHLKITLDNLEANTDYEITGINYFYQDGSYKYNFSKDIIFTTLNQE
ncbi:hypothetical protein [Candidatus Hepatoplasma crinochetorum]|uniref:RCC1 domain-containing protein n=1 Tax=Candidatus Hepatoplasma crinochetorum TaxID=295596 RepID=UPI00308BD9FA|nr:MAG: hypothetical protein HCTKY_2760 [Candidatus Hepatoplasma crinochetorum]